MHVTDDSNEREKFKVAGLIWLPVLNHRLGGEVKGAPRPSVRLACFDVVFVLLSAVGVVVHRNLNGLTNEMTPSSEALTLIMRDPTGSLYRHGSIPAGALLSQFSFAISSESRTGTHIHTSSPLTGQEHGPCS